MVSINLDQLEIYRKLLEKVTNDPVAGVLNGLIISLSGDANELLGFIRNKFPSYTGHDLQHSWRILKRLEDVITSEAIDELTAIEIFSLIIAVAFHDIGMISDNPSQDELRQRHHIFSDEFLNEFLHQRMSNISEYLPRLVPCIGFIARAHGMHWEEMISNEYFRRTERIFEQKLRVKVLAILLRIGDLLDLDSDRTCDPLRKFAPFYFIDKSSKIHHDRHKHVEHFLISPESIEIEVISHSKDEHLIWAEWLGYIKQDILHANTYVFKDALSIFQLPKLLDKISHHATAKYELWPLRFEIDEKGKIWDVISQSIYTGRFDFLRELIQNSIDACLKWIYVAPNGVVNGYNPKYWSLVNYKPYVYISYSELHQQLVVADNGIGMDKYALKHFLFNVASSGHVKESKSRDIQFPSIAKFGIGFVSCLIRAEKIIIKTKSRENSKEAGRDVILKTEALDAYSEIVDCEYGTSVRLYLNKKTSFSEIRNYITNTINSPAVRVVICNLDRLEPILKLLNQNFCQDKSHDFCTTYNPENIDMLLEKVNNGSMELKVKEVNSSCLDDIPKIHEFYLNINPIQESVQKIHQEPIFLYLNNDFSIIGISKKYKSKRNKHDTALLAIPVFINDQAIGLEWVSIHIFLINRRKHERTLVRYVPVSNSLHDIVQILSQDEYEDERINYEEYSEDIGFDFDDLEKTDYFELKRGKSQDFDDSRFYNDGNISRISEKLNGIVLSDIDGGGEDQYSLSTQMLGNIEKYKRVNVDELSQEEKLIDKISRMLTDYLNGDLFQDGIRLSVNSKAIAPIGATYARCNLYGNARFELNVTRNYINESHVFLNNWMSVVARKIQKTIIDKTVEVFNSNKIEYELANLILEKNISGSDVIYEYATIMLNSIFKKM